MSTDQNGRVAVITGASSGIGDATAGALAAEMASRSGAAGREPNEKQRFGGPA
jgi:NAD(P)-dependent dehydrogenase (short-subunit alcohol dehydrogenase family)